MRRLTPLLIAALLAPAAAQAQVVDTGQGRLEILGQAPAACLLSRPRIINATNAVYNDTGAASGEIGIVQFVDNQTAQLRPVSVDLALPVICNSAHRLTFRSTNGGLLRDGGNARNRSTGQAFGEFVPYEFGAAWATRDLTVQSEQLANLAIDSNAAAAGDVAVRFRVNAGGGPLVAGRYAMRSSSNFLRRTEQFVGGYREEVRVSIGSRLLLAGAALTMFSGVAVDRADAMTVQPVVIDLQNSGRGMAQVVTVENTFATPLPVELRIDQLDVTEDGVKLTGKDPGDLLVFPPQALIQPGQTQTFRIQYVGDPDLKASKHYYVTVAQLPVKLPEGQSAIQILYNFQVLVSIAPAGIKPALTIQSAGVAKNDGGKPVASLVLGNASAAHGYLSSGRLRIVQKDASGKEVFRKTMSGPEVQQTIGFGLVGAGQTRKVTVPVELPFDGGSVEASFTPEG